MILLNNERVYKVNHLKNERVCVEKCRFLRLARKFVCTGNALVT